MIIDGEIVKNRRDVLKAFFVAGGTAATAGAITSLDTAKAIASARSYSDTRAMSSLAPPVSLFFRDKTGMPIVVGQSFLDLMPAVEGEIGVEVRSFRAVAFNTGYVCDAALVRDETLLVTMPVGLSNSSAQLRLSTLSVNDGDILSFPQPLTIIAPFSGGSVLVA